ncbi:hypothetical protein ALT_3843 [Aspergillus lentulus]|uniref:Uncharacterized protein n=2 Tax=Aspergillus lentulus TaxID=293939 RepID=A0AAN5YTZ7_ASPLE|nr:hypothetical protein CNMCM6069_004984 [Aspergillus lentulus]KAF4163561.1 hypothetical protein CNMCM6936_000624 [Aspergillus lentulus]KAF4172877.1 hypothetical protein CNMCM8060_000912 [Aspergillus lentulus]KAF4186469.1 hypothetical protein CNMCM7927_005434 [Aspergillus lentulus]KAF4198081.1 hypothetical protein CNMCM8694_001272 [Aspergillus lentulus]
MGDSSAVRCIGVKVDIWMQNGSLWANDSMAAAGASEVLSSAYFKSMLEKLDAMNSHSDSLVRSAEASLLQSFDQEAERSSVLLLELRSPVEVVWPDLTSLLEKLRTGRCLSYMNGTRLVGRPVTVVVSSENLSYLDRTNLAESDVIFFDTSLESLTRAHPTEGGDETDGDNQAAAHGTKVFLARNSTTRTVMATADFQASVGLPRRGRFSKEQIQLVRAQVRAAHQHGLLARYTGIKCHPRRLRRLILRVLAQEGVDLIENDQNDCERPW